MHDIQGNVRALLDDSGKLLATYRYSAFGQEEVQGDILSPWGYSGKRLDTETGLVYYGERYYDPMTQTWITQDPLGDNDGPNLYQFVHNNPLYYSDPDGRFAWAIPLVFGLCSVTWGRSSWSYSIMYNFSTDHGNTLKIPSIQRCALWIRIFGLIFKHKRDRY